MRKVFPITNFIFKSRKEAFLMQKILIIVTAPDTLHNIVQIRTPATQDFISCTYFFPSKAKYG